MSNNWFDDVRDFHNKFNVPVRVNPGIPSIQESILREDLIDEETGELKYAMEQQDLIEIADGIADSIYVLIGTALVYGIPLQEVWDEVQRTNMAKTGGTKSAQGKILKPQGWLPPDINSILNKHTDPNSVNGGWNPDESKEI